MQCLLHCSIATTKKPSVTSIILAAHHADVENVHTCDIHGLTPVHVAAASENAHALHVLLSLDASGIADDLRDRKNEDGITPLGGLESSMRSTREAMETLMCVKGLLG